MSFIQTYSKKCFDLFDMDYDTIDIESIAHALSLTCRYGGHCEKFYCVTPETLILNNKLDWVRADSLCLKDKIYSIEEKSNMQKNMKRTRKKLLPATIKHTGIIQRQCYKITLENGDILTSSSDHPWLVATKAAGNQKWVKTEDIYKEYIKGNRRYLPKFLDIWEENTSKEAGWLSGMFDGEGTISKTSNQISIAQKEGIISNKIKNILNKYTDFYSFTNTNTKVHNISIRGKWADKFKFLGTIKPDRIITNLFDNISNHNPTAESKELVQIKHVEFLGIRDVVALETSSHTYFANGYAAHNSVAQHSIILSNKVPEEDSLWGLLHDAAEAYMGDIPKPFKKFFCIEWIEQPIGEHNLYTSPFEEVEDILLEKIMSKEGLSMPMPKSVHIADAKMCSTEVRDIMKKSNEAIWAHLPRPYDDEVIIPWSPEESEYLFLEKYKELKIVKHQVSTN